MTNGFTAGLCYGNIWPGSETHFMLFKQEDKKAMMEAAYLAATAPKPKAKKGKKGKKGGKSRPTTSQSKK